MNAFESHLATYSLELQRAPLRILQVNVGRKCNQACRHCHVDAGPWRVEMLTEGIARRIGLWISQHRPPVVDITGGAPELSDQFRYLVEVARAAGAHVIDRCNLTIIEEPGFDWLPGYLSGHQVEVIASLPCYTAENVNKQRGNHVFEKSISALKKLNAFGYGRGLALNLVYNPLGPKLPPSQSELEADYKAALSRDFGIVFDRLLALTNQPIARFAEDLRSQGKLEEYMDLLVNSFNAATLHGLMCRDTLSVDWLGQIYDCDFNQMLGMQMRNGKPLSLWDVDPASLTGAGIRTGSHCFACTAGSGSSCGGALEN